MERDILYIFFILVCVSYHFYRINALKQKHFMEKFNLIQERIKEDEELMERVIAMERMVEMHIPKKK